MAGEPDPKIIHRSIKTIYRELKPPASPADQSVTEVIARWQRVDAGFAGALQSGILVADALGSLGVRLCLQNRYAESLEVLNAALLLAPNDIALINNLAVVLERSDQTETAMEQVERSLALSSDQPDSWIFLGNMRQQQGDLAGSADAYQAAIDLDAGNALAWQCLGLVRQKQQQFEQAIECLRRCLALNLVTGPILSILGQLFYSTGQFKKSRDAYSAAVEIEPLNQVYRRMLREVCFLCAMIDGHDIDSALNHYLIDHAGFAIEQDTENLLHKSFAMLGSYQHTAAAEIVAQKRAALFPTSASALYYLGAIRGDAAITRSPDRYIVETFDRMADRFDDHLTQSLGYDIPRKLSDALISQMSPAAKLNILDAGCGTGLCGPFLRPFARTLTGVDLSPAMLRQAGRRGYDTLVCSELTSYLNQSPARFDAIISADVIIYFGDLIPLATAFARALRPGGLLAFSIESTDSPGYQLLSSGRFCHHPENVRAAFAGAFVQCVCRGTVIRSDATRPVPGNLFVFRCR